MEKSITNPKTGIQYTLVGEVYLPNLLLPKTNYEIGLWGRRHLDYIREYQRGYYSALISSCKLNSYLHEIDTRAKELYEDTIEKLAEQRGIDERLKDKDMFAWARAMNNIANQARELVYDQVIFTRYFNECD